jgi:hypothetical protein
MSTPSTLAPGHSRLLDLPPELFELIALHLPPEDLPSLRVTCRDAASKVYRAFVRAHFRNPCYLLNDESSLDCLFDLSCHPVFAKTIKQLWFGIFYNPSPTHNGAEEISSELKARRSYLLKDQLEFFHNRRFGVLCSILDNFKHAGNIPDLRLVTADIEHRKIWASPSSKHTPVLRPVTNQEIKAYKPVEHNQLTRWWGGVNPTVNYDVGRSSLLLFDAIIETGFPVKNLDLGNDTSSFLPECFLDVNPTPQAESLRSLRLTLNVTSDLDEVPEWIYPFLRFLYAARNLEHLFLRASRDGWAGRSDIIFHHAVTKTNTDGTAMADVECESLLPKISSLELLSPMSSYFSTTLRFLKEHRNTLTDVKLGFYDGPEFSVQNEVSARRQVQEVLGSSTNCKGIVIRVCETEHWERPI